MPTARVLQDTNARLRQVAEAGHMDVPF